MASQAFRRRSPEHNPARLPPAAPSRPVLLLALALATASGTGHAAAAEQPQRPMSEMHGDCSNFGWDLSREFKLWSEPAAASVASAAEPAPATLEVGRRYAVTLTPQAGVRFTHPPQEDRGGPDKFAGLLVFSVSRDGLYRLSASNPAWVDVVDAGDLVPSAAFEMQTGCRTIFKSVAFPLRQGRPLLVQVSGSPSPTIDLLITPVP